MSEVTIDAARKIGEAIIADAVVEKTTRDTLLLRFSSPQARETASVLIALVGAQRGISVIGPLPPAIAPSGLGDVMDVVRKRP